MGLLQEHGERWHELARSELDRIGSKVPESVLLSMWWSESKGIPGEVNEDSGAAGLGQVLPIALKFYNTKNSVNLAMADMRNTESALLQARVSTWLLDWNIRAVKGWDPTLTDRDAMLLGLLAYHQGWPGLRKKLDELHDQGYPTTWESVKGRIDPSVWKAKTNVYSYHEATLRRAERICLEVPATKGEGEICFKGGSDDRIPPRPPILKEQKTIGYIGAGLLIAGVLLAILALALRKG